MRLPLLYYCSKHFKLKPENAFSVFISRCGVENSELRIPVFPPPPASPSPSQCDSPSPAPLALTPEEQAQLQHCKIHGLPRPAPAKPVPYGKY